MTDLGNHIYWNFWQRYVNLTALTASYAAESHNLRS